MLPATTERVRRNTPESFNDDIERQTRDQIWQHVHAGEAGIGRRLQELDEEWDIERVLEANAASVALIGLTIGVAVDRRFLALPGLVAAFLLQHALQGWCPPVPLFRRLGVRTQSEIERERYALKAIRGDFSGVVPTTSGRDAAPVEQGLEAVSL
jgi:hypothetical protein